MKFTHISEEEGENIRRMYFDEYKSIYIIKKDTGRSHKTIHQWLKKFGKPRTWSEAQILANRVGRGQGILNRGKNNGMYKNGRSSKEGYKTICLQPDDPYYKMRGQNGFVMEHRYAMAQHLNRPLTKDEIVHHLNGIRTDNRIENLALVSRFNHPTKTLMKLLQKQIRKLEAKLSQKSLSL